MKSEKPRPRFRNEIGSHEGENNITLGIRERERERERDGDCEWGGKGKQRILFYTILFGKHP